MSTSSNGIRTSLVDLRIASGRQWVQCSRSNGTQIEMLNPEPTVLKTFAAIKEMHRGSSDRSFFVET